MQFRVCRIIRIVAAVLAILAMLFAAPVSAGRDYRVKVLVNDVEVSFPDQRPFVDTGVNRVYVPVRFVSEALGANVDWLPDRRAAFIEFGDLQVVMPVGEKSAAVSENGKERKVELDAPALLLNSRVLVPLRFVSEALGRPVMWVGPAAKDGWGKAYVGKLPPPKEGGPAEPDKVVIPEDGGGGYDTTPAEPW